MLYEIRKALDTVNGVLGRVVLFVLALVFILTLILAGYIFIASLYVSAITPTIGG